MMLRNALILMIWAVGMLLLSEPSLCEGLVICANTPVPLVILLGVICFALTLFDIDRVLREARERTRTSRERLLRLFGKQKQP
jgi:hypothetical protein